MMVTKKALSRRTLLRGVGTAIALPLLDAMKPALTAAPAPPLRFAFVYVPNGIDMRYWTPSAEGSTFELPRILSPLERHREQLLVLTGLTQNGGRALGDGAGDHARAAASFLTGTHPRKTDGADIRNGISIDQVLASRIGSATRFASLEIGLEEGKQVGNCDSGYSCAYSNNIAWRSETSPLPPETVPRQLFDRLFGTAADTSESAQARTKRLAAEKSILDFAAEDTRRLKGTLGPADRRKLDEYLYGVRDIELRIERSEKEAAQLPPLERPDGYPASYADYSRLMFDLLAAAFECDLTRVATFMMAREGSTRAYREIGISDGHHPLTHHQNKPEMMEKVFQINCYHMEQFAWFLDRLREKNLLQSSIVLYGSGISDGNSHTHHDLPVVLAGGAAGAYRPGRHVRYDKNTPMANLFLNMSAWAGAPVDKVGDSSNLLSL
jgi:hypothetical protein